MYAVTPTDDADSGMEKNKIKTIWRRIVFVNTLRADVYSLFQYRIFATYQKYPVWMVFVTTLGAYVFTLFQQRIYPTYLVWIINEYPEYCS